jgi:hypothetical protein
MKTQNFLTNFIGCFNPVFFKEGVINVELKDSIIQGLILFALIVAIPIFAIVSMMPKLDEIKYSDFPEFSIKASKLAFDGNEAKEFTLYESGKDIVQVVLVPSSGVEDKVRKSNGNETILTVKGTQIFIQQPNSFKRNKLNISSVSEVLGKDFIVNKQTLPSLIEKLHQSTLKILLVVFLCATLILFPLMLLTGSVVALIYKSITKYEVSFATILKLSPFAATAPLIIKNIGTVFLPTFSVIFTVLMWSMFLGLLIFSVSQFPKQQEL